jgi:FAD/FMN-containing dehydrogenase
LNITAPEYNDKYLSLIEPFVYELVCKFFIVVAMLYQQICFFFKKKKTPFLASMGGSISAEHGLGQMKPIHIGYSKPRVAVDLMRQIKTVMDPNGILNPYKVLPPSIE